MTQEELRNYAIEKYTTRSIGFNGVENSMVNMIAAEAFIEGYEAKHKISSLHSLGMQICHLLRIKPDSQGLVTCSKEYGTRTLKGIGAVVMRTLDDMTEK